MEPYQVKTASKPVAGSRVKMVTCEAHFPSDVEATWKLLNAFSDFPSFVPRVLASESLGTSDEKERLYILMDIPWPLPDIWNILVVKRDIPFHRLSWEMVDGNMKKNVGDLSVEPDGAGSVVKFSATVDVGMGLPRWLVAWGARHFFPKVLIAIGRRLEEQKIVVTPTPTPSDTAAPLSVTPTP